MTTRLIDEIVVYVAPHLMGSSGLGMFDLPDLERMRDRVDLSLVDVRAVGADVRVTARLTARLTGR